MTTFIRYLFKLNGELFVRSREIVKEKEWNKFMRKVMLRRVLCLSLHHHLLLFRARDNNSRNHFLLN